MSGKPRDNGKLVISYIKKYPRAYKLSLAKLIYSENPGIFKDVDQIRNIIRYYYNQNGTRTRDCVKAYNGFMSHVIPTIDDNKPSYQIQSGKALIISDIHGHKHHPLLRDFFLLGKDNGCDHVILNGDIVDNEELSKWPQTKRATPFQEEMELMHELLADVADMFPDAVKIYKKGNHELWWDRELWNNPKLMSNEVIAERLKFEDVLQLKERGFTCILDRQPIELGKLLVVHGHEAKRGGQYIAKSMLEYYKRDVAFGHFHRVDYAKFDIYGGETIRSFGLPCARDLSATYTGINNQWSAGCAICQFTPDDYTMDIYVVNKGKIRHL